MMPKLITRKTSKRDKAVNAVKGLAAWKLAPKRAMALGAGAVAAVGGALAARRKRTPPPSS